MEKKIVNNRDEEKTCLLSDLKLRSLARVVEIKQSNVLLRRRLFEMGLTKGVEVCVKKIAPLGDPISIELRGYELCLRKDDLKNIKVIAL